MILTLFKRVGIDICRTGSQSTYMLREQPSPEKEPSAVQPVNELTALALEYQLEYGTASRDLNIADLINNPAAGGKCRINSFRLTEHPSDTFGR